MKKRHIVIAMVIGGVFILIIKKRKAIKTYNKSLNLLLAINSVLK